MNSVNSVRRKLLIKIFCSVLLLSWGVTAFAQQKKLDSLSQVVNTVFKPLVADAVKIGDSPVYSDSTARIPAQTYSITPKPVNTTFNVLPIKPAQMLGEPLNKLYNSFVSISAGLPGTFNGEGYYNSLRSKDYSWGILVRSLAGNPTLPNAGYSDYSDNQVDLYGKKFYSNSTLSGDLDYTRNVVHDYGYNTSAITITDNNQTKQIYNFISPSLRWVSHYTDSTHLNYDLRLNYFNLQTYAVPLVNENNVSLYGTAGCYYHGQWVYLDAGVNYINSGNGLDTVNQTILRATPGVVFRDHKRNKWKLNFGIPVVCDFSKQITPNVYLRTQFDYDVLEHILIPYAGIDGGYDVNDFKTITDINPFLAPNALLQNSSRKYELFAGIRGTMDAYTSYNMKATYSSVDNMPFFVTDYSDLLANKFDLVYDNVQVFNLHGELSWQKTSRLRFYAKADYNHYQMSSLLRPWYKPQVILSFAADYSIAEKIILKANVYYIGKQLAQSYDSNGDLAIKQLNGFLDLNLGINYNYSRSLHLFVNLDNIANTHYDLWNNYPTQGILAMAGASFMF